MIRRQDEWFLPQPGAGTCSPWQLLHPCHPIQPWFPTIWVALDDTPGPVRLMVVPGLHDRQICGRVEFCAGVATLDPPDGALPPVPDIDTDPDRWRMAGRPARAGPAILMDSRTLPAAGGLCRTRFRRISIRHAHPESRIVPRRRPIADFRKDHAFALQVCSAIAGATFPALHPR